MATQTQRKWIADAAINADKLDTNAVTTDKILDGNVTAAKLAQVYIQTSEKGAASGVATLDANSKIPSAQIPAIAITDVFSVADITARDALTVGTGDGEVQEGDVVIVTDASADANITAGAASYIYDGSAYQLLKAGDEVLSVNGNVGTVVLDSADLNNTQAVTANWTAADGTSIKVHLDEVASRLVALETDTHTHANKAILDAITAAFTTADETKLDFITVTQAVNLDTIESDLAGHLDGGVNKHDASEIDVEAAGTYTTVADLATNLTALDTAAANNATAISDHLADAVDAHDASAISVVATGNLASTDVQAALTELQGDIDTLNAATVATPREEIITLLAGDITNKYVDLALIPAQATSVSVTPVGGPMQERGVDYNLITDGSDIRRISWNALGLDGVLAASDSIIVRYES